MPTDKFEDMGEEIGDALVHVTEDTMENIRKVVTEESKKTGRNIEFVPNIGAMELPEIPYDWQHIADACVKIIQRSPNLKKAIIVLPICLSYEAVGDMNRARLIPNDKKSPMGIILKNDPYAKVRYMPYVGVQFAASEMLRYASYRISLMMPENENQ